MFLVYYILTYIILNKTDCTDCTMLLKCNYMISGRDGNVAEQSEGMVGNAEVLDSNIEEERLQDRNKFLLSKVNVL